MSNLSSKPNHSPTLASNLPHYYEVLDPDGNLYRCCGQERDAWTACKMAGEGYSYKIVYLAIPLTVDVNSVTIEERKLQPQNTLPETQQEPFYPPFNP